MRLLSWPCCLARINGCILTFVKRFLRGVLFSVDVMIEVVIPLYYRRPRTSAAYAVAPTTIRSYFFLIRKLYLAHDLMVSGAISESILNKFGVWIPFHATNAIMLDVGPYRLPIPQSVLQWSIFVYVENPTSKFQS